MDDLARAWRELAGDSAAAERAYAELLARWREPQRHYHTVAHLAHMLSIVDRHASVAEDPDAVRFAVWFHDAVYEPTEPGNEERSAELAVRMLPGLGVSPARVAEVARLVRLTVTHAPEPGDRDGALLCDADLAILASDEATYDRYVAAVRREYAHVPDDLFAEGRKAVVQHLLAHDRLFHALVEYEQPARDNLQREL